MNTQMVVSCLFFGFAVTRLVNNRSLLLLYREAEKPRLEFRTLASGSHLSSQQYNSIDSVVKIRAPLLRVTHIR